ncbi:MAG TPA: response regulator [Polyangiaceae bacterium]|nr:response regulator [Polyangiaceae bacterium]
MNARRGSGTRNLSEVRRVLIVDDNHDSAELLALVLEREGHETRVAHDPAEAIPLAVQFRPNLAFLDIGLPGMDGYELLGILRATPELEGCKFIAVTGYDDVNCGARGFDGHLRKPVDLSAVVNLVLEIGQSALSDVKPATA